MFRYQPSEENKVIYYTITEFDYIPPSIDDDILQKIDEHANSNHVWIPLTLTDVENVENLKQQHRDNPRMQAGHLGNILWINNIIYHCPNPIAWIGSGAFGTTEYVQDVKTAEWFVLKTMRCQRSNTPEKKDIQQLITRECAIHSEIHQKKLNFLKFEDAEITTFEFVMPLEKGRTLDKAITHLASRRQYPEGAIFDLLINSAQAIQSFHEENKLVHRDIKPLNMVVDPATRRVRLVDFGLVLRQSETSKDAFTGTLGYMPPEVNSSAKADIHALGKTYAQVLGLTVGYFSLATPLDHAFTHNTCIKDPKIRAMVLAYLTKMTSDNPDERPSAKEVKENFGRLRDLYLDAHAITRRLCFLHVDKTSTDSALENINLGKYDEVVLIAEKNQAPNNATLARMRKKLDSENILIRNELIVYPSAAVKNKAMFEFINRRERTEKNIYKCYQASAKGLCKDRDVYHLTLTSEREMTRKIIRHLQNNIARLEKKYPNQEADNSIAAIKDFIEKIRGTNISMREINAHLKTLQKTLLDQFFVTHRFKFFLKKHFHYTPSTLLLRDIRGLITAIDRVETERRNVNQ